MKHHNSKTCAKDTDIRPTCTSTFIVIVWGLEEIFCLGINSSRKELRRVFLYIYFKMYAAISAVTNSNANLILVATDDFIKRRVCLVYATRL